MLGGDRGGAGEGAGQRGEGGRASGELQEAAAVQMRHGRVTSSSVGWTRRVVRRAILAAYEDAAKPRLAIIA
ncbi:hypothetical protein GCM10010361_66270 [Streptomyces olivaceiscleroticus]|uniref:Uncharacterized protein n=1 Tax=Streptomyces olivaceiscleroticus TaxID=68245 RepID=A0ABN1B7N3_9ACTN